METLRMVLTVTLIINLILHAEAVLIYSVCSTDRPGGSLCSCQNVSDGLQVDCRGRELTAVPNGIDVRTKELLLSNNKITNLTKGPLNHLTNLEKIYLDRNQIESISDGTFDFLYNLKIIILASNKLRRVENGTFKHLPKLNDLDLTSNGIISASRYSFFTLPSLSKVNFAGNSFVCGCEEKGLKEWLLERKGHVFVSEVKCTNFNNKELKDVNDSAFPSCPDHKLFKRNIECLTCADVAGMKECGISGTRLQCIAEKPVCYNLFEYTRGHFGVSGGCMDYDDCIEHEIGNAQTCVSGVSSTLCHFCCVGNVCNQHDIGGRAERFDILMTVELNGTFTHVLQESTSREYTTFVARTEAEFDSAFNNSYGGFTVSVMSLSEPKITVRMIINATTVWFNSKTKVTSGLEMAVIRQGTFNGFQVMNVTLVLLAETCQGETIVDDFRGTFVWPLTQMGRAHQLPCPIQDTAQIKNAFRQCVNDGKGNAEWQNQSISDCPVNNPVSQSLQQLSNVIVIDGNVVKVAANISLLSDSWRKFEPQDVHLTASVIENILALKSSSDTAVSTDILKAVSNMLNVNHDILRAAERDYRSSSRLLSSVQNLTDRVSLQSGDFSSVQDNVAAFSRRVTATNFPGASLVAEPNGTNALVNGQVSMIHGAFNQCTGQPGISVPVSLFDSLTQSEKQRIERITFTMYRNSRLFESMGGSPSEIPQTPGLPDGVKSQINSHVFAASIPSLTIEDLQKPVNITLAHLVMPSTSTGICVLIKNNLNVIRALFSSDSKDEPISLTKNARNPVCVYWSISGQSGGHWSSNGCSITAGGDTFTICACNHLTNFALLMDVYGTGGSLDEGNKTALSYISYIGCGTSLFALILTLLTFGCFRRLRKDKPSKILMNLSVALACTNLVFLAGMQDYTLKNAAGCKVVAVLLHFFLLASMCWMAVESYNMYLALVKVFNTYIAHFLSKTMIFGWGVPIVIVAITLGIHETDNYGYQPGEICWMDPIPFYAAFLAPVGIMLILNCIAFYLVYRQLVRRTSSKLGKTDRSQKSVIATRLRGAFSVIILLGLTWIFGFFAVDGAGIVFQYLFAIFNSLQGFFIFVFYCFMKKDARTVWIKMLPCCPSSSEETFMTRAFSRSTTDPDESRRQTNLISIANSKAPISTLSTSENHYDDFQSSSTSGNSASSRRYPSYSAYN